MGKTCIASMLQNMANVSRQYALASAQPSGAQQQHQSAPRYSPSAHQAAANPLESCHLGGCHANIAPACHNGNNAECHWNGLAVARVTA